MPPAVNPPWIGRKTPRTSTGGSPAPGSAGPPACGMPAPAGRQIMCCRRRSRA